MSDREYARGIVGDILKDLLDRHTIGDELGIIKHDDPPTWKELEDDLAEVVQARLERRVGGVKNVKYMDVAEFGSLGFLQEANRLFFHPRGLALEVSCDKSEDGSYPNAVIAGVWDYRDDPEGMVFADGMIDPAKVSKVEDELRAHWVKRADLFGRLSGGAAWATVANVQPYDWKSDGTSGD